MEVPTQADMTSIAYRRWLQTAAVHLWGAGGRGMILYDYVLSASCYKVRLMAALLGVPLTLRAVKFSIRQ